MQPAFLKTVLAITIGLVISACSSDSDDTPADENSSTADDTSMPTDENEGDTPLVLNDFNGTWVGTCDLLDPEDANSLYEILTLTINGDVANSVQRYFTDSACEIVNENPVTREISWSITYPGAFTTTSLGEATHLNRTIEDLTLNGEALTPEQMSEAPLGVVVYDIALLIDNTLYIGDRDGELDGTSAELRPTALDEVIVFSLQP